MAWIEWALSKELVIPKIFIESYQPEQEATTDQPIRSQESYRSENERIDKAVVQQVGLVLHTIYPECPISQLTHLPPINEWVGNRYTEETILLWLKDAGIRSQKPGRLSNKAKEALLAELPEEWRASWKSSAHK